MDPYDIEADKCQYVDQQTLKLQEAPETVPTGEMPRHLVLVVERSLADRVAPGTRVSAVGIVSTMNNNSRSGSSSRGLAVKSLYLRVLGIMVQGEQGSGRTLSSFTHEEEEEMRRLTREPNFYDRLSSSVAPSISGDYTTDIKKAILCLLVAGSRKILPDGVRLRGDINVLLLGDPSTAKSQFLKFVEKVAPVGVYTSGKGSSAAGLTASVIRDSRGEFYLEGGAMVLGDGGVVCIDEFDKMREEDRVAIHEAMEQQTISVAKAGITTILNSRCAVLAAANPVFGRYDDTKSAADNIDLLPTILSRFDLIFIVRDVRNAVRDTEIARHVMRVHMSADAGLDEAAGEISMPLMKRYISYARARCAPRLSPDAAEFLRAKYVEIRQEARGRDSDAREARLAASEEHSVIPVTVRQLEALVRITEAVAKVTLSKEATITHAEEALRLFRVSTLNAAASGLSVLESYMPPEIQAAVQRIEKRIASLIPVGGTQSTSRVKELLMRSGFLEAAVQSALRVMERRGELTLIHERKTIRRDR
jgi:DNA replication licensing factor MCM5